jgi:hypothetical protein
MSSVGTIDLGLKLDKAGLKSLAGLNKQTFNTGNAKAFSAELSGVGRKANGLIGAFGKVAVAAGLALGAAAAVKFGNECVKAASTAQGAFMGLQSILAAQGRSFGDAKGWVDDYVKDGLVPLQNAVTAYKNLAARGYDDAQIRGTLEALKDSAAFGRQSSYTLGEAVQSATEGLKNENSILVDNAGVTKNVAKMWQEYAGSVGKTTAELTQADRIQAEYLGIMRETAFQTGDAARYAQTYQGRVSGLSAAWLDLKTNLGAMLMTVLTPLIGALQSAVSWANSLVTGFMTLVSTLTGVSFSLIGESGAVAASGVQGVADGLGEVEGAAAGAGGAAKKAMKALLGFDSLNVLPAKDDGGGGGGSSGGGGGGGGSAPKAVAPAIDAGGVLAQIQGVSEGMKGFFDPMVQAWSTKGAGVVASFKTAWGGVTALFGEIGRSFATVWTNGTGQRTLELVFGLVTSINTAIGGMAGAFAVAWAAGGRGTGIVQNVWDGVNNLLTIVGGVAEEIAKWWNSEEGKSFADAVVETVAKISDAFERVTKVIKDIWDNGGRETFGLILDVIGVVIEVVSVVIGYVAELSAELAEWVQPAVEAFLNNVLNPALEAVKDALKWLTTDGKPVLEVVAALVIGVATAVGIVTAALKLMALAQAAVNLVMSASPLTWIVLAVGALIAVIILLVTHWDEVTAAVKGAWDAIVGAFGDAAKWIDDNVVKPIVEFFTGLWDGIVKTFKGAGKWFKDRFTEAWKGLTDAFSAIGTWFSDRWNDVVRALAAIPAWFRERFQEAWTNLTLVFAALGTWFTDRWNDLKAALAAIPTWFKEKFQAAWTNLTLIFTALGAWFGERWSALKTTLAGIPTWFKERFQLAWTNLTGVFSGIASWFGTKWGELKSKLAEIPAWFKERFASALEKVKSVFKNLPEWFKGVIDKIVSALSNIGSTIGGAISQGFKTAINTLIGGIEGVINSAIGKINGITSLLGFELGTVSLPRLASGGYVAANTPQLAVIGDNRHEGEIVAPESKMMEMALQAAAAAVRAMAPQQQAAGAGADIVVPLYLDGAEVARAVRRADADMRLRSGGW